MNRPTRPSVPRTSTPSSASRSLDTMTMPVAFSQPSSRLFRPQDASQHAPLTEDHRGNGVVQSSRAGSSPFNNAASTRGPARSFPSSSMPIRATARPTTTYEPRVIRADASNGTGPPSFQPSSSSASRTRRTTNGRPTNTQRTSPVRGTSANPVTATPFARPGYLEHSSLRYFLQPEPLPTLPLSRKADAGNGEPTRAGRVHSPSTDSDEDSNVSPPRDMPPLTPATSSPTSGVVLLLPTRWSDQYRHPSLSITGEGRDVVFNGPPGSSESQASAARTSVPVPPACGIYYYEVEVVNKGTKGHISIGFAGRDVKLSRLPGWEKNSWGYHGDDGMSFAADRSGTQYGPKFGTGDTIGCGVDFTQNKGFYTKNGVFLGLVFENIGKDIEIYPSIGLQYPGEAIRVNFGHEPFRFDIDSYVQQQRNQTWAKILTTPLRLPPLPSPSSTTPTGAITTMSSDEMIRAKNTTNHLVLSYLSHHGYAKTAKAFKAHCERREGSLMGEPAPLPVPAPSAPISDMETDKLPSDPSSSSPHDADPTAAQTPSSSEPFVEIDDIELRTHIVNAVVSGDLDSALADTRKYYGSVLEHEEGLMLFKLRCRKFVELILEAAEMRKRMSLLGAKEDDRAEDVGVNGEDDEENGWVDMDVDDDTTVGTVNGIGAGEKPKRLASSSWHATATLDYEKAIDAAIAYGRALQLDYKDDTRPDVYGMFKKTFGIVAYEDLTKAGEEVAVIISVEARMGLANELNQAILKSQGKPTRPALESIYRQAATCVTQLGLMGVGAAAFADIQKEFLDT